MISSPWAPARAMPSCLCPLWGKGRNLAKPAAAVCYLCSSAENVFLFFLKKKLLLNLRNGAVHSWKDLWGKQKPISAVNVILSGNCQIIIPLQHHHCLIVPSNILLPWMWMWRDGNFPPPRGISFFVYWEPCTPSKGLLKGRGKRWGRFRATSHLS